MTKVGDTVAHWKIEEILPKRGNATYYLCRCQLCGETRPIAHSNLYRKTGTVACLCNRNYTQRRRDLSGQKFGTWRVKAPAPRPNGRGNQYWEVECEECGNTRSHRSSHLLKNPPIACECQWAQKARALVGTVQGNLKILSLDRLATREVADTAYTVECLLCGTIKSGVRYSHLTQGKIISCGCEKRRIAGLRASEQWAEHHRECKRLKGLDPDKYYSSIIMIVRNALFLVDFKRLILERDEFRCVCCDSPAHHVHHILSVGECVAQGLWESIFDPNNLVSVCSKCHFDECHAGNWHNPTPPLVGKELREYTAQHVLPPHLQQRWDSVANDIRNSDFFKQLQQGGLQYVESLSG